MSFSGADTGEMAKGRRPTREGEGKTRLRLRGGGNHGSGLIEPEKRLIVNRAMGVGWAGRGILETRCSIGLDTSCKRSRYGRAENRGFQESETVTCISSHPDYETP